MKIFLFILIIINFLVMKVFCDEYKVPRAVSSISINDINSDGNNDIITGHLYDSITDWTGISILFNNQGKFSNLDSIYLNGQHRSLSFDYLDNDNYLDLITEYYSNNQSQLCILFNFYIENRQVTFNVLNYCENIITADINNDGSPDIIIVSNQGQFWGVLYNDGNGNFFQPTYFNTPDYHPTDLACGDLNGDGRDDVAICGQSTVVYFSYPEGFKPVVLEENDFKEVIRIADMDQDGDNDIVGLENLYMFGNFTAITMYENVGNDTLLAHDQFIFAPALSHMEISDVQKDGFPDLVCTGTDGLYVLDNQGNFLLSGPRFFPIANYGEGARRSCCADLNGDGYDDVATIRWLHANLPANLNILFNDRQGNFVDSLALGIQEKDPPVISDFQLGNYPNPFNSTTRIHFSLPYKDQVELGIYSVGGERITTLFKGTLNPGKYSFSWDGTNRDGEPVASGVYLYELRAGNNRVVKKMLLVK